MQEVVLTVYIYIYSTLITNVNCYISIHNIIRQYLKLSIHFFLGLPLPLLPSISLSCTLLTSLSGPISAKASLHFTCLFCTFSSTLSCFSSSQISTFLTLSNLLFSAMHLSTLISVACTADSCCLFSTHFSLAYISVGTTMALYIFSFVPLFQFPLPSFHLHLSSLPNI